MFILYLCMSSRYSLHRLSYKAEIWTTKSTCNYVKFFGNRLFYFRKNHIWTYSSKIKVPQCSYYDYIFMYVCICVCPLATAYTAWAIKLKFEPGSLHMISSKRIFYFFEIFIFRGDIPFFDVHIIMPKTGKKEK